MKKHSALFFIIMSCAVWTAFGQPKTAPSWTAKFASPISWQRVHNLGYIVVCTSDALYGVNPHEGTIIWENRSFAGLDPANFNEIPGTEFVSITYGGEMSNLAKEALIEVINGKVLFDSKKEGIGVLSRHILPASGKLVVIGARPNTMLASLFMYDIATGSQVWANDDLFKVESAQNGKGLLGSLQQLAGTMASLQGLAAEPFELDKENMIIVHPKVVMKINSTTGKVLWKNPLMPSASRAGVYYSPTMANTVFLGIEIESTSGSGFSSSSSSSATPTEPTVYYENLYHAFDLQSGKPLWKQPAKEKDMLNQVIFSDKGLIICPRSSQKPTINLVNYQTGQTMWGNKGKGIKAQGSVTSYITTPKGLLITTAFDNAWNNKAEEYYLNLLDPNTGALKFEKSVKLKGDLIKSELISKGLMFATTKEINILDTNTGTLVWPSSIEAGNPLSKDKLRPFPTGQGFNGKVYVYSPKDKAVYEIDKAAGTYKKITTAKIEFEGKEMPKFIDVVEDGIIMTSEQNVMKLGFDGLVKFYKYYPAPRQPALVRALLLAQAVRAAYIGAAASTASAQLASASQKTTDPTSKVVGEGLSQAYGDLGEAAFTYSSGAMKEFNSRYKASLSTPEFVIMMTPQERKGNQLVQVSKRDGQILNAVDIKNEKEPEYDVDEIYKHVYYRPNATDIVCYKLK